VPSAPAAAEDALRRALAHDPEARFASSGDFARALAAAVAPAAATAPPGRRGATVAVAVLAAVLAVGVAALATGAFGRGATPEAPRGDETDVVRLVKAGRGPLRPLRLSFEAGRKEVMRLRQTGSMKQTVGDPAPLSGETTEDWRVEIRILSVDDRGRARIAWTLENAGAPAVGERAHQTTGALDAAGGLEGSGLVDGRGAFLEEEAHPRKDVSSLTPLARAALEHVPQQVQHLFLRLPQEPIGVGAVWEVSRRSQMFGLPLFLNATFELVELDGNRARVRASVAATATPQDFRMPGTDRSAKIHSLHVSAEGESLHDLDRLAPAQSDGKGTMRIAFGRPTDPEPSFGFEATQTEHAVRE
jgi:hypothetical protein